MVRARGSDELAKVLKQLDQASEILSRARQSLVREIEARSGQKEKPPAYSAGGSAPDTDPLRVEYEKLLRAFADQGPQVAQVFVQERTIAYLQRFFRANDLPIDVKKQGKEKIAGLLSGHLAQSLAIRGNTLRGPPVGRTQLP